MFFSYDFFFNVLTSVQWARNFSSLKPAVFLELLVDAIFVGAIVLDR